MATEKISAFSLVSLSDVDSFHFLGGADTEAVDNFRIAVEDLLQSGANVGGGEALYKNTDADTYIHQFKTVTAGRGITLTAGDNELEVAVTDGTYREANDIVPLSLGGTGAALTAPLSDSLFFYDVSGGTSAFLTLGTNLAIDGNVLNATDTNTTYTAGSGLSLTDTEFSTVYGAVANSAVQGNTQLTITAGTGLSGSATITLGAGGTVTLNNTDGGSDQNIWKTFTADTGSTVANTNSDSFQITGGTLINTTISGDTITIDNTITAGTGLTFTDSVVSLNHLGLETLTDPGSDQIVFWDDSANSSAWLTIGSSLEITNNTINVSSDYLQDAYAFVKSSDGYGDGSFSASGSDVFSFKSDGIIKPYVFQNNPTYGDYVEMRFELLGLQDLQAPQDNQLLYYNASTQSFDWLEIGANLSIAAGTLNATTGGGGGGSQNLWETITADTGSTTANSTTDTLTIAGGSNITTSIVGDTLTIAASFAGDNLGNHTATERLKIGTYSISYDDSSANDIQFQSDGGVYMGPTTSSNAMSSALEVGFVSSWFRGLVNIAPSGFDATAVFRNGADNGAITFKSSLTAPLSGPGFQIGGMFVEAPSSQSSTGSIVSQNIHALGEVSAGTVVVDNYIQTEESTLGAGSGPQWRLGSYQSGSASATGYVVVRIGNTRYRLLAEQI